MKSFFAAHRIASIIVAVIVIAGGLYWYVRSSELPSDTTTAVTTGNIIASLNESGAVVAENSANLSFEESGQIVSVPVKEGQTVGAGTLIAKLDTSALENQLEQAQAAVLAAQAGLATLASGTRPEQLAIDQSSVSGTQSSVVSATASLSAAEASAYTAADDAIRDQTDNLFQNPNTNNPAFIVPVNDSQLQTNLQAQRVALTPLLNAWYATANSSSSDINSLATLANTNLATIASYLNTMAPVVDDATANSSLSATTLAGYKANIETARTEVTQAITAITAAENALAAAQSTLAIDQSQLALAEASATPQQIQAQQAAVAEAQAAEGSAQVALNNASLIAPFAGTVTNLTAQVGQVVAPGAPVLSLTNNTGLKVVVYVSGSDVAQLKQGDKATVTLDAYGTGTTFPATVATIDNAETVVNGTPAYGVTLYFVNPDPRIASGMTASAQIVTAEHDNVLEVPSNLIINNNGNYFVLVQSGKNSVQQPVQIGIAGNGMTEITSGLSAGQTIVNF